MKSLMFRPWNGLSKAQSATLTILLLSTLCLTAQAQTNTNLTLQPGDSAVLTSADDPNYPQPQTILAEVVLAPNSQLKVISSAFSPAPPSSSTGQLAIPSRTLLKGSVAVSFKTPTKVGQKGSLVVSTGPGNATMHTLIFGGISKVSQTPSIQWVVGPSEYYAPGMVKAVGVAPGVLATVQVKTNDGSDKPFYLDILLRN